jgi:hypothetical protein
VKHDDGLLLAIARNVNYQKKYSTVIESVDSFEKLMEVGQYFGVSPTQTRLVELQKMKLDFYYSVLRRSHKGIELQATSIDYLKNILSMDRSFCNFLNTLSVESQKYEFQAEYASTAQIISSENFQGFVLNLPRTSGFNSIVSSSTEFTLNADRAKVLYRFMAEILNNDENSEEKQNFNAYYGKYVFLSRIALGGIVSKNELIIMAKNKLFVDVDLDLEDTHLIIAAPIVEVVEQHVITLRGFTEPKFKYSASNAQNSYTRGANGADGKQGYSSGNFTLMALTVVNAEQLTIKSIGSDGAPGQDGGNGFDGVQSPKPEISSGSWGTMSDIYSDVRSRGYEISAGSIQQSNDGNSLTTIVYNEASNVQMFEATLINKKNANRPTGGGHGGTGGSGALPGAIHLFLQTTSSLLHQVVKTAGKNGHGGTGGKAGKTVSTCTKNTYTCTGTKSTEYVLFIKVSGDKEHKYKCHQSYSSSCPSNFPAAEDGKSSRTNTVSVGRKVQKRPSATDPPALVISYCKYMSQNLPVSEDSMRFLQYIVTTPGIQRSLTDQKQKESMKQCKNIAMPSSSPQLPNRIEAIVTTIPPVTPTPTTPTTVTM